MSDSLWKSSARSPGTLAIGPSNKASQILGTNQPRPFLLSPEKIISDTQLQNRVKLKVPIRLVDSRNKKYMVKQEISRSKQASQWSLSALREREKENLRRYREQSKIPMDRNMSPRKPKRPKYIPSPVDTAKLHEKTRKYQSLRSSGTRQIEKDANVNLNFSTTQLSRTSSLTSSNGSIPEFPVPSNKKPARKSLHASSNLGSKRANSTFYSRPSVTSLRNEEFYGSSTSSYHTYASSAALPSTFRGSVEMPKHNRKPRSYTSSSSKSIDLKTSKIEVAKQYSLLNINNVGMALTSNSDIVLSKPKSIAVTYEKKTRPSGASFNPVGSKSLSLSNICLEPNFKPRLEKSKNINNSIIEFPPNFEPDPPKRVKVKGSEHVNSHSTVPQSADISSSKVGAKKKSLNQDYGKQQAAQNGTDKLNQADQKISVTSLLDLIRRVSKVIAQINGGKGSDNRALQNDNFTETYTKGDISYMHEQEKNYYPLAAHLEYGVNQNLLNNEMPISNRFKFQKSVRKRDRYCGLPVITFIALIFILILFISAAIFIPLIFFVFHKQRMPTHAKPLGLCTANKATRCENGGFSFLLSDNTCGCICTNNFTGKTCTTSVDSSVCSSIVYAGQRVIIGSSVERLIMDAQDNFSIPLNIGLILARFNTASLSCLAENALVTFNGKSFRENTADDKSKRMLRAGTLKRSELLDNDHVTSKPEDLIPNTELILLVDSPDYSRDLPISSLNSITTIFVTVIPVVIPPNTSISSSEDSSTTTVTVTITSPMIPLAPAPSISDEPSHTITQISPASPQSTSSLSFPPIISPSVSSFSTSCTQSPTSTPISSIYVANEVTLDFARVITLFILQRTDLNQAITAQTSLQRAFGNKFLTSYSAQNLTISNVYNTITVDLVHLSVDLGDGSGIYGSNFDRTNNTF